MEYSLRENEPSGLCVTLRSLVLTATTGLSP